MSLLEILVAITILAILGGPMIMNMVVARRSVKSSSKDVRAVLRASSVLEVLLGIPYARLPVVAPGAASDLPGAVPGLAPGSWASGLAGGEDLTARLSSDSDPETQVTYVWIEALREGAGGGAAAGLEAKEISVTVEYRASGTDTSIRRRYTLRALVPGEEP